MTFARFVSHPLSSSSFSPLLFPSASLSSSSFPSLSSLQKRAHLRHFSSSLPLLFSSSSPSLTPSSSPPLFSSFTSPSSSSLSSVYKDIYGWERRKFSSSSSSRAGRRHRQYLEESLLSQSLSDLVHTVEAHSKESCHLTRAELRRRRRTRREDNGEENDAKDEGSPSSSSFSVREDCIVSSSPPSLRPSIGRRHRRTLPRRHSSQISSPSSSSCPSNLSSSPFLQDHSSSSSSSSLPMIVSSSSASSSSTSPFWSSREEKFSRSFDFLRRSPRRERAGSKLLQLGGEEEEGERQGLKETLQERRRILRVAQQEKEERRKDRTRTRMKQRDVFSRRYFEEREKEEEEEEDSNCPSSSSFSLLSPSSSQGSESPSAAEIAKACNRVRFPTALTLSSSSLSASISVGRGSAPPRRGKEKEEDEEDFNFSPPSSSSFEKELFGETSLEYQSLKKKPLYQDLTHEEAKSLREAYSHRLYRDRTSRWMRMYGLANPEREARALLRENEKLEKELEKEEEEEERHEVPRLVADPSSLKIERMAKAAKRAEIVSRIRAKIREEKLANAKLMKASIPNVAGHVIDPIKYHVARRTIRLGRVLQSQLEEILTWNSPDMLYGVLDGAAVSIHHVEQRTTKSICYVYYTLTSSHDPVDTQRRLDLAAPRFRFQIARRLQLGYTPEIRFLPYEKEEHLFNKKRLFRLTHPSPSSSSLMSSSKRKKSRNVHEDQQVDIEALRHGWIKSYNGFP